MTTSRFSASRTKAAVETLRRLIACGFVAVSSALLAFGAHAQSPTVITNPAIGVFTGGINLTARIDSAAIGGVVITVAKTSGNFISSGTLRLCRGNGNTCETVAEVPYAAGAATVTFPSFTPRVVRQDYYYVQRVDAAATTTGGLDPNVRSGSMIIVVDNPMTGQENVAQVSVAGGYACALITSGAVKCWSGGDTPQLLPGAPASVTKVALSSSSSTDFSCLLASGTVYCWGNSVGDGTSLTRSTPVAISGISGVVTDLFVGYNRACALTGTAVWCWRDYGYEVASSGQLNAPYPATLSPVAFSALGNTITEIHMNVAGACALNTAADVLCWGTNLTGNLGNAAGINSRTLFPVGSVSGLKGKALAAHASLPQSHVCVVTFANDLWCWGDNYYSQLGRGASAAPTWQPAPATLVTQNVVSAVVGGAATCAIHPGGKASCWGDNSRGRLGIGGVAEYQPTGNRTGIVVAPGAMLMGDAAIAQLSMSDVKSCAALADGSLRCAGPAVTVGSTSIPSSTAFAVDGFGPKLSTYTAPTITQATRARDIVSLGYQDNLASGGAPITAHQWACYPQSNGNIGNAAEVVTNEASGALHVVQGTLSTRTGPWQCKLRFRTPDGVSAWSSLVTIAANAVAVPTITSAIYDGEYGTVTWRDNNSDSAGPITPTMTYCTVQWRNAPTVQVAGCEPPNSRCILNMSGSEPANQLHVSRLPLPPATDFSSGSCRVFVDTMDGSQVSADVPLVQAASPAPTIVSGRVVGTQGVLTFTDNRTVGAGNIVSAVYACTRVRDGATSSTSIAINEPANSQHTITVPLLGNNLLQDPDSYSCKVRVTPSAGTVSPDSPAFVIGANTPPVVSNFSFTSTNGVISGAFDINDPEGDPVKNVVAYFGSTPRSMECSTGTLGAGWDVPRGGGRVPFTASLTNVGCGALTGSATTIYGFVTAQDVNGLYATIVQAQAGNTPPPPTSVTPTTSYSIVFDAVPTTLAVKQAVDITMRMVDQNGVTATSFNGPVKVALSISGIGFSVEDPINPAAVTHAHRVVWLQNGVGRLRALRIHDGGVLRLSAFATSNGSYQLNPVLASISTRIANAQVSDSVKAAAATTGAAVPTEYRGLSIPIRVGVLPNGATTVKFTIPQTADIVGSSFFQSWKSGNVKAYLISRDDPAALPYGGVVPDVGGATFTITAPYGSYRLVFVSGAVTLSVRVEKGDIYTGIGPRMNDSVRRDNLPIVNSARKVLLVHGVFGSALQWWGATELINKCLPTMWGSYSGIAAMPKRACKRSSAQERALGIWDADSASCADISFLCEGPLWGDLKAALVARGYEVVTVPYDWRLTPDDAQREFLANAIEREVLSSGQPVDIVAHSMGGIVSMTFLASLANDGRLSGYVDRLVMLGTPIAGSVNAYGLMEVADPLGMERVALSSQGMYSSVARYLWDASLQSSRSPLYKCGKYAAAPNSGRCIQHIYDSGNTQGNRQTAFTEQSPSGWFLYPNRAYLPFAGKPSSAVAHIPAGAKPYFARADSPNSLSAASSHAECRAAATGFTNVNAARKTNVSLLLSNSSGDTLSTVETRQYAAGRVLSINEVAVSDWGRLQPYSALGDGTVPVDGQPAALAAFLGTTAAALQSPISAQHFPCLIVTSAGEHADLTRSQTAIDFAIDRLPYPGLQVAATAFSASTDLPKVAQATTPQLTVTTEGAADLLVRDIALPTVGRSVVASVPLDASAGITSATTLTSGNRVKVVVTNPSLGASTVQVAAASGNGVSLETLGVRYTDAAAQVLGTEAKFLLRSNTSVTVVATLQVDAPASTVQVAGPAAIRNLRAFPGPMATILTWTAPATSAFPISGYRVYASLAQNDEWVLVGSVGPSTFSYSAPFPAVSMVQREVSFVVVGVDAQDRFSEVLDIASNRVRDDVESSFGAGRGNPGTLVLSPIVPMPNNVPISASVTGGEASVNGGAWLSTGLLIPPFANVQLRGVASSTASQWTTVTLNGPTTASSFSILAAPPLFCRRPTRPVVDSGAFIRYLDGISGAPLMQGLYPTAEISPTAASTLGTHYSDNLDAYDFNGDGFSSVDVDGLLYARYALGFRSAALVSGIAVGTVRTTAQIEAALAACQ